MEYAAAKPRLNRFRHSSVPCLEHLILLCFTDWFSVSLEIGFMAHTDAANDVNDPSVLAQNTEHTRTVTRVLKPELKRRFIDQASPLGGSWMIKRPGGGFTEAEDQGGMSRSAESWQGDTRDLGKSTRATKWTRSPRSLSKDSGESVRVSTNPS